MQFPKLGMRTRLTLMHDKQIHNAFKTLVPGLFFFFFFAYVVSSLLFTLVFQIQLPKYHLK